MKTDSASGVRVLMIGPLPPPVGGMATVVGSLASVFDGRDPGLAGVELRLLNNVKTTAPDRSPMQAVASQVRLLWRLASICLTWRPQLVHIHTCSRFTFWRNAIDALLARLLLCPFLLHIHGAQFHRFLGALSMPQAWLARRLFGLSSRVIVLGEGWKQLLDSWAAPRKVVVVPNGVPVQLRVSDLRNGRFRITCLANYEARKGQADLIRAVARLKAKNGVRLELFGFEAEPGQCKTLLELAAELGIAGSVEAPGPISGPDKDSRLRDAHCFCLPSYNEGLPMSMLEAMALGLPVVVTRVGAIPEALVEGVEGLMHDPGDVDALTAHLQTLHDDPARAASIGNAGRERLIHSFSLERSASLLRALYCEVVR
ncbi:MAG: glycosyltransferase family 4 protein [Thiohalocapsa sp.]